MGAKLTDLLDERHVVLELRGETRDEALCEIVAAMNHGDELREPEKLRAQVRAREEEQTTFMGDGVAFPHARTDLVAQIVLGVGRSAQGVPFGKNGERAHLIFLIAVPRRMITDYLVFVGALARIAKEKANRDALMAAGSPAEFLELLRTSALLLE